MMMQKILNSFSLSSEQFSLSCTSVFYTNVIKTIPYFFRKQAQVARIEAEKEGIVVPLTLEDYCIKTQVKSTTQEPQVSITFSEILNKG